MSAPHEANQAKAVERILAGEDSDLADLTIREIRSQEERYGPLISDLAKSPDPKIQARARLILRFWGKLTQSEFTRASAKPELLSWADLEVFCWQLAEVENPETDTAGGMAYLDQLGQAVEKNLPRRSISPTDSISALRQVLARREGFRGNLDDYFHPSNSYLHRVVETKLGIPLTLALVYIFAGQRAGLEVYGLNTPGHYLAEWLSILFTGGWCFPPTIWLQNSARNAVVGPIPCSCGPRRGTRRSGCWSIYSTVTADGGMKPGMRARFPISR